MKECKAEKFSQPCENEALLLGARALVHDAKGVTVSSNNA